ncbi:MAG: fasciclin domain-containing protein, partial [Actinobacteria bacterium]|nr:fasciclin domain-containing protein [Actinomycetota bacterium]
MKVLPFAAVALAAGLVLAGCSSSSDSTAASASPTMASSEEAMASSEAPAAAGDIID